MGSAPGLTISRNARRTSGGGAPFSSSANCTTRETYCPASIKHPWCSTPDRVARLQVNGAGYNTQGAGSLGRPRSKHQPLVPGDATTFRFSAYAPHPDDERQHRVPPGRGGHPTLGSAATAREARRGPRAEGPVDGSNLALGVGHRGFTAAHAGRPGWAGRACHAFSHPNVPSWDRPPDQRPQ